MLTNPTHAVLIRTHKRMGWNETAKLFPSYELAKLYGESLERDYIIRRLTTNA